MKTKGRWHLRHYLAALLTLATVLTALVVVSALLFKRLPELERQNSDRALHVARDFAAVERTLLRSTENRLALLARMVETLPVDRANELMDVALRQDDVLSSLFVASSTGKVVLAALRPDEHALRGDMLGSDLSRSPLVMRFMEKGHTTWSAKYLSLISGSPTVGVATGLRDGRVLVAELAPNKLLSGFSATKTRTYSPDGQPVTVWVVDGNGEVLAHSDNNLAVGKLNLAEHPAIQASTPEGVMMTVADGQGAPEHMAAVYAEELDWHFLASVPAGLQNARVRATFMLVGIALLGSLLTGLALAPFWARGLSREIDAIVARVRSRQGAAGHSSQAWPRGLVREFNYLSEILGEMDASMQEREHKLKAIFNAAPVPMSVTTADADPVMLDVNDAWCSQFGQSRESVVGRSGLSLELWRDPSVRAQTVASALQGRSTCEASLRHTSGQLLLCRVSAQRVTLGTGKLLVWSAEDLTEVRRNEAALRTLNIDLEHRVAQRTAALTCTNSELREAMDHLQHTRDGLVRSEKMAALGKLVAGVAHELNTPLGNSLMATTTLRDEAHGFSRSMKEGLRRAALDRLLAQIDQATEITQRNLGRAVDLVTSFKQVAVDQTSAQRRPFELKEVVQEILLTLKPSLSRTPYQVSSEVPEGLVFDSYPGPLGQVLANLISNAVQHGFEDRAHGHVRIEAQQRDGARVELVVIDDGRGVAAELLPRIFDPFVTTRMGRGGTGLGLNIAYNLTNTLLGGDLDVQSRPGEGTRFTLNLPMVAPQHKEAA